MAQIKDLFDAKPQITFDIDSLKTSNPNTIWANYDLETDSMLIYVTGKPVRSVAVLVDDNAYVMVDPFTNKAVGLQIEAWESQFVPAHPELKDAWTSVKSTLSPSWSLLLRIFTFWLISALSQGYPFRQTTTLQIA